MKSLSDLSSAPIEAAITLTRIRVTRPFHGWLYYHVLTHLDLGRSPASLHAPHRQTGGWIPALTAAARAADALALQTLPLTTRDYETLMVAVGGVAVGGVMDGDRPDRDRLDRDRPDRDRAQGEGSLGDGPLGEALRRALVAEFERVALAWQSDQGYAERLRRFWSTVAGPLERCRRGLWGDRLGPLSVLDVPTLGRHGRSVTLDDGRRVVAVSLDQPAGDVLSRLVYEESCAVIGGVDGDPRRRPRPDGPSRVIERAQQVIAAASPQMIGAFEMWRSRAHGRRATYDQQPRVGG